MAKTFKQIKEALAAATKVSGRKTNNPAVVVMVGVSGVGNSTLAKELRRHLDWPIIEKNKIRVELRERGHGFTPQNTDEIAYAILGKIFKKGGNAILDSDFAERSKRKKLEKFARRFRAKVIYLHLICAEDIVLSRIIHSRYDPQTDIFKNVTVAVREHMRRLPWHYRWSETNGGSWLPRGLGINFGAEINTESPRQWKKKIRLLVQKLRKL